MLLNGVVRNPSTRRVYIGLVLLRVLLAFFGTGYIHPDEYFQNGEVTAGIIYKWHTLRTWEWDPVFPCRSIVPPLLTTGLLFYPLKLVQPGPRLVFTMERMAFLVLSFVLDYSVTRLVSTSKSKALLLVASSHVLMTFQVRPFSNSLEAVLVATCLVLLRTILSSNARGAPAQKAAFVTAAGWLAAITILGTMTRVTFIAFTLPIVLQTFLRSLEMGDNEGRFSIARWLSAVSKPVLLAALFLVVFITADTLYFRGDLQQLVLTPYNNLAYNLSPENLAKHGLHPRWLHVAVNLPLIVGPGLLLYGLQAARRMLALYGEKSKKSPQTLMNRTCTFVIVVSMLCLSAQPHQEPRFLTPLVVPFVVLVANSGYLETAGKLFWMTWLVGNAVLILVFGVLHQGGVVQSLFHLNGAVSATGPEHSVMIAFWKTYMPPWHLLGISEQDIQSGRITVADMAGQSPNETEEFLSSLHHARAAHNVVYLVTPEFAIQSLKPSVARCFDLEERAYPHLDLDHIPESMEIGWLGGLSLGVYKADGECFQST